MLFKGPNLDKLIAGCLKSSLHQKHVTNSRWIRTYIPTHLRLKMNMCTFRQLNVLFSRKTLEPLNTKRNFSVSQNLERLTFQIYRHDTSALSKVVNEGYHRYLILLIILFTQIRNREEVKLTGRMRVVPFMYEDPKADIELGKTLIKEIIMSKYGGKSFALSENQKEMQIQRKIEARFNHLITVVNKHFPESQSYTEWEVHVVPDATVNAACLPGGKMVVHTGLLEWATLFIEDLNRYCDSQIGGGKCDPPHEMFEKIDLDNLEKLSKASPLDVVDIVLAHEIAHAFARHGSENIGSLNTLVTSLIKLIANLTNSPLLNTISSLFLELPYSRTLECEADHIGMIILLKACRHMEIAPVVYGALGTGTEMLEFLSTHPQGLHRYYAAIKKIDEIKEQHGTNEHCEQKKRLFDLFFR